MPRSAEALPSTRILPPPRSIEDLVDCPTFAECAEESAADVGVMTTLLEARWLAGNAALLDEMRALDARPSLKLAV